MIVPIEEPFRQFFEGLRPILEEIEKNKANIEKFFQAFSDVTKYSVAIHKLGDAQFVVWSYMKNDFRDKIIESDNVNKTLREFNIANKYRMVKDTIERSQKNHILKKYLRLYYQSVEAFWKGWYDISVLGFVSVIDGLMSDISKDSTTKLSRRLNIIMKKIDKEEVLEDDEYATMSLAITFEKTMRIFSCNSDFRKKEPKGINRHWIAHGRSSRRKTKLDCVKMINLIYGLILIHNLDCKCNNESEN